MSELLNFDSTYRIETTISIGAVEDPITGEEYTIESKDDGKGGIIEVERPDSAYELVENSKSLSYAGKSPKDKHVKKAQKERYGFKESDLAFRFANNQANRSVGLSDLDAGSGFDPENDGPNNDPRMKIYQAYRSLKEANYDDEAEYLRRLPAENTQTSFADFLYKEGVIER